MVYYIYLVQFARQDNFWTCNICSNNIHVRSVIYNLPDTFAIKSTKYVHFQRSAKSLLDTRKAVNEVT